MSEKSLHTAVRGAREFEVSGHFTRSGGILHKHNVARSNDGGAVEWPRLLKTLVDKLVAGSVTALMKLSIRCYGGPY